MALPRTPPYVLSGSCRSEAALLLQPGAPALRSRPSCAEQLVGFLLAYDIFIIIIPFRRCRSRDLYKGESAILRVAHC
jgi:hypothetical protein